MGLEAISLHQINRSFVLRQGRLSPAKKAAFERCKDDFTVEYTGQIVDWQALFPCQQDLVVEVGFGMGDSLIAMAQHNPQFNFVGIEVHLPGVVKTCLRLHKEQVRNVRLVRYDAYAVLEKAFAPASVQHLLLLFPDPWQKRKHHKRRIVNAEFAQLARRVLVEGGVWYMATDWQRYAQWMQQVMASQSGFERLVDEAGGFCRMETKFERRAVHLGHAISNLLYRAV